MLLESNERTCTLGRFQRPETRSCELERREREREKEGGGERGGEGEREREKEEDCDKDTEMETETGAVSTLQTSDSTHDVVPQRFGEGVCAS